MLKNNVPGMEPWGRSDLTVSSHDLKPMQCIIKVDKSTLWQTVDSYQGCRQLSMAVEMNSVISLIYLWQNHMQMLRNQMLNLSIYWIVKDVCPLLNTSITLGFFQGGGNVQSVKEKWNKLFMEYKRRLKQ